ncbi:MAG: hypothetical protein JW913_11870 [Chitinispirillaceae bacterium]|nr:hypothetical protein [Chitinispirillaceae bacterium]
MAQLLPNQLRLYDMASNCLEWCNDFYKDNYVDEFTETPCSTIVPFPFFPS